MLYNAKNGTVTVDNIEMDYISFGNGSKNLVIIPGLGDGLRTVKGLAVSMAYMYRIFAKEYKVYMFSQSNNISQGYTTKNMADDIVEAMDCLNIKKADIVGVSMGGMVAQHIATDFPEYVGKLVLVATCPDANNNVTSSVVPWIDMAQNNRYKDIMADNFKKLYSDEYLKKYRFMLPIATRIGKPESFERFIIMANACLSHNSTDKLSKITAPTLIIGGEKDQIVGVKASYQLNEMINKSGIYIYPQYGHALYDEAKDFNKKILDFLNS